MVVFYVHFRLVFIPWLSLFRNHSMSSETVDWLKKVTANSDSNNKKTKVPVSFDAYDEAEMINFSKAPKANAIRKQNNYTSKDLSGLKVSHDFESFEAGKSDILVLEDRSVLNSEEDEFDTLVSTNLKEEARLKRQREISRHAREYSGFNAYEEEKEVAEAEGLDSMITLGRNRKKVLQKYDFGGNSEFTDEPEGFRLGSVNKTVGTNENDVIYDNDHDKSSNVLNDFDTVQSSGIDLIKSFKPSTKKGNLDKEMKRARKLAKTIFADEPEMISEPIDQSEEIKNKEFELDNDDDDDLDMQKIIAATRKERLKNPMLLELEIDNLNGENEPKFSAGKSFNALIMSESIFAPKMTPLSNKNVDESDRSGNDDHLIKEDKQEIASDELILNPSEGEQEIETFSSEPLVRNGVASTLALLNMRGINLKPRSTFNTNKLKDNDHNHKNNNQIHINQPQISDVKLEYFDRFGNKLNSKEAYKELSRKFHGKGPGKGKLDKMKRRREETVRMESLSASGAGQSAIVTNLRRQQEESGTPYMILSNTRNPGDSTSQDRQQTSETVANSKPKIFGLQLNKKK